MGGNLYKVQRVSRERYDEIVASLKPVLDKHFGDYYRIPIAYHEKSSYGDVDIILDAGFLLNKKWEGPLLKDLGDVEVKKVRNVTSVLYMNFQVDFFCVSTSRFISTSNFMNYNIFGNLIGRIYHKFNLKYGEDGLKYVLRGFNEHISKEIVLSRDMKKMLEFLELSYDRWTVGFKNLNEIFEYVIGCKYFCSNSYSEDYFNVRKRATERPDFNSFLDYLKQNNIDKNYPFEKNKEIYLPMINDYFPESNLVEKYKAHVKLQEKLKTIHDKFNGKIIMELLPLEGKELGQFINSYKEHKGDDFERYILESNQGLIEFSIKNHYNMLLYAK